MQDLSLQVFVYGTLKQGLSNHSPLCDSATSIVPARVWGRLYDLPAGYPAVVIPDEAIFALGTANPTADALAQNKTDVPEVACSPGSSCPAGDWDEIWGELVTFPCPEDALPGLDLLEEFMPHRPYDSLYQRVLVPATTATGVRPTWIYTMGDPADGTRLHAGVWPSPSE